jgi:hypothetical protein
MYIKQITDAFYFAKASPIPVTSFGTGKKFIALIFTEKVDNKI